MPTYSPDRWQRHSWQTDSRYYMAEVTQDLFGQWQLHRTWGSRTSARGGEQRLELTGFSPDRLDWYKGKGCFTEIIRYRTRLFVPVSAASSVLPALAA